MSNNTDIHEMAKASVNNIPLHEEYEVTVKRYTPIFITVNGDEHVIIFAKRDIEQWEELTYNYRFSSVDEQLACYCGAPRCRGVVNDVKAVDQIAKLCVPRSDLTAGKRNCK